MHEHHSNLAFTQPGIELEGIPHEVVQRSERLDAREAAPRDDHGQQAAVVQGALVVRFLKRGNHPIAQVNGIAKRLHGQCVRLETREVIEVRDRAERDDHVVVLDFVRMTVEAVGHRTRRFSRSIDSTLPTKTCVRRKSVRRGLTMCVTSRSLAAISWSIGVNRKKFS